MAEAAEVEAEVTAAVATVVVAAEVTTADAGNCLHSAKNDFFPQARGTAPRFLGPSFRTQRPIKAI